MAEFLLVIAVPVLWGFWELFSLSRDAARRRRLEGSSRDCEGA